MASLLRDRRLEAEFQIQSLALRRRVEHRDAPVVMDVADALLEHAAGQAPAASMHAMMLDMKRAWDELIEQRAPPDKREKILSNRFYQSLSSALAGSQEYIAMEKLCEVSDFK